LDLLSYRWPSTPGPVLECRPLATDELAVPTQERGGCEHQLAGLEVAAEGGEDQPIGWEEIGPFDLAAQNGDLVPKRQNLQLRFFGRVAVEFDGAHDQPNHRIDGREEHEHGPYSSAGPVVVAKQPRYLRLNTGTALMKTAMQLPKPNHESS
jgi:hypothetical protein